MPKYNGVIMTPQEFLAHVLPAEGFYCLAAKTSAGIRHRTYESIDDLVADATELNAQGHDLYFSISTLRERQIIVGGKSRIRVGQNCLQTRSLILDVDVRPDKPGHHTDNKEALQEVAALAKQLQLGTPTIVFTGGGFHVYWTADVALSADDFANKSAYFKSTVLANFPRLGADPTRIGDRTSLLRIPSFINHKRQETVRILRAGTTFPISAIGGWVPVIKKVNGNHSAAFNLFAKSPPVKLDKVIQGCAQLKEMSDTGGANCTEPLWYAALNVIKHGENANVWAHQISLGHSGYSYAGTEAKLVQAMGTNSGPTTCRLFGGLRSAICSGCPFNGKITSPIQLASGVVAATTNAVAQINFTPPWPYKRRATGGIEVCPEEGSPPELVYDYDLFPTKKLRDESTGEWLVRYKYFQPIDGWREETAALSEFYDKKSAFKALMRGGVVPTFGQGSKTFNVGRYMVESIRDLEKKQGSSSMYNQLGWRHDDTAFIVGNRMYAPGVVSEVEVAGALKQLVSKLQIVGSLQRWTDVFEVYNRPGLEAYAFGALLAFAGPLYKFTGHNGVIFNMVGEKGSGKSTVLKVIASVWMKPEEQLLKESDTINSAEVILGAMHNLPVMYDEITNIEDKKLSDLCYNITQGRGRNRLNADAKLKTNHATWSLILCSTSNLSLVDKLGQHKANSSAEAIRIFEVRVDGNTVIDKAAADAAFKKLDKNYGVAGDIYAKYIVDNRDAIIEQLEETTISIDADLNIKSPERFWSALLACVVVGGEIAKNLGLHGYNMDKLYAWAAKHISSMRTNVEEKTVDPISILGNFLASKVRNTIVVVQGKHRDTLMPHLRDSTQIRLEIDPGVAIAFIEYKALVDYCKLNNISISWWEAKLRELKIIIETGKNKRLAAGCNDLPAVNVRCWAFNLTKQEFRADIDTILHGQERLNASVSSTGTTA